MALSDREILKVLLARVVEVEAQTRTLLEMQRQENQLIFAHLQHIMNTLAGKGTNTEETIESLNNTEKYLKIFAQQRQDAIDASIAAINHAGGDDVLSSDLLE